MSNRVIAWFSCGAASAVAAHLALKKHGDRVTIANIYIKNEHPDNARFLADCERWYNREIIILRNDDYDADVDAVVGQKRYLNGRHGAPCTGLLKKVPRYQFQMPDDLHIWGYTVEERDRARRAVEQNPELDMEFPLIDAMLTKQDCFAMVNEVGIELPTMYKLGFNNNNCIGCVKAQSPRYWNRIRRLFPDVFERRSRQERRVNYALCRVGGKPVFLDELPVTTDDDDGIDLSCSLLCQIALNQ